MVFENNKIKIVEWNEDNISFYFSEYYFKYFRKTNMLCCEKHHNKLYINMEMFCKINYVAFSFNEKPGIYSVRLNGINEFILDFGSASIYSAFEKSGLKDFADHFFFELSIVFNYVFDSEALSRVKKMMYENHDIIKIIAESINDKTISRFNYVLAICSLVIQ